VVSNHRPLACEVPGGCFGLLPAVAEVGDLAGGIERGRPGWARAGCRLFHPGASKMLPRFGFAWMPRFPARNHWQEERYCDGALSLKNLWAVARVLRQADSQLAHAPLLDGKLRLRVQQRMHLGLRFKPRSSIHIYPARDQQHVIGAAADVLIQQAVVMRDLVA
jgi:hypothetical protein